MIMYKPALASAIQIHPHRLGLGEILDRRRAVFAAEARIAHAAPWQPHIGVAIGIDPDGAGVRLLRETLHAPDVAAPYPSREAVGSTIGNAQRIGLVAELDDTHHGTEDFLLRYPHLVFDVPEHPAPHQPAPPPAPP